MLGVNGRELIRVDYRDSNPVTIPDELLQNKADRYYFTETMALSGGAIYQSPMDLNVERGEIEVPYKPMIRFGTCVYDQTGVKIGIVVINYLASGLLEKIKGVEGTTAACSVMLLNPEGYWLKSTADRDDEWGFMFGKDTTFRSRYPDAWEAITRQARGVYEDGDGIFVFSPVDPAGVKGEVMWQVTHITPERIAETLSVGRRIQLWTAGILLLGVASFSYIFARIRISADSAKHEIELLSHVVEQSPVSIVIINANLAVVYVNEFETLMSGFTLDECIGKKPRFNDDDRENDAVLLGIQRTLSSAGIWRGVIHATKKSGERYWEKISCFPVFESSEESSYFIAFKEDVTIQKEAETELRRNAEEISDLYENAPCGYHTVDEDGLFLRVNETELSWLGYERDELVGKRRIGELLTDESADALRLRSRRLIKGGSIENLELDLRRKDGEIMPVLLNATAVLNDSGGLVAIRAITIDDHERKQLIRALREAKSSADLANRAKSDFLANMSHEILTPMNAIIGFSDLALRTKLTAQQYDYVSKLKNAGISLLTLINDILDFSKIEAGRLDTEEIEFDLLEVIKTSTSIAAHGANLKGLELLVDVPLAIPTKLVGDPHRLGQILNNLLGNSIKFTEKGEVELRVVSLEDLGDRIKFMFTVHDTGIGMSMEQVSRLFQPFVQADSSTTRKFGGTGLGLSITKRLVELMGGQIWVDSEVETGTSFSFTVWFGQARQSPAIPDSFPGHLAGMRVLVVDDNNNARTVLASIMESINFRVDAAPSGESAIDAVAKAKSERDPYGLILMDMIMDGIDGIEATRRIRREGNPECAIIILSSSSDGSDTRRKAMKAGASDFLYKPVTSSTIVDSIITMLVPDMKGKAASNATPAREPQSRLRGASVLLVEDNEINQQIARELLGGAGIQVVVAGNGKEALDRLINGDRKYDLILMDIQMPEMDELEATRQIRKIKAFASIPIIAMTAHALVEERQKAIEAGMNDHVSKPIDPDAMFATINRFYDGGATAGRPGTRGRRRITEGNGTSVAETTAPSPESVITIDGFDTQAALKRVSGNVGLYLSLLADFESEYRDAPAEVIKFIGDDDRNAAKRLIHAMKGVSGNIGATRLYDFLGDFELMLKAAGSESALQERIRSFDSLMRVTSASIHGILRAYREAPGSGGPDRARADQEGTASDEEILDRIRGLAAKGDLDAIYLFNRFQERLSAYIGPESVERISSSLRSYDFPAVLEILDALA